MRMMKNKKDVELCWRVRAPEAVIVQQWKVSINISSSLLLHPFSFSHSPADDSPEAAYLLLLVLLSCRYATQTQTQTQTQTLTQIYDPL